MSERLGRLSAVKEILKATLAAARQHEVRLFAPAIAYALVVSLAPLTAALNLVGSRLISTDTFLPGSPLSPADIVARRAAGQPSFLGPLASVVGLLVIVWGAATLFRELVTAIGRIAGGEPPPSGIRAFAHSNAKAFALLGAAGFALFASALAGSVLSSLATAIERLMQGLGIPVGWVAVALGSKVVLDFLSATMLYLVAFVLIPSRRPRVRDVLPGALITAAAYSVGQVGLSIYLRSSSQFASLGEFGSFLGFLVWAYYTSLIILWGAELTYQIARRRAVRRGLPDSAVYDEEAAS